eukprot:624513-Lingulodinium_polyedra.AAC.1
MAVPVPHSQQRLVLADDVAGTGNTIIIVGATGERLVFGGKAKLHFNEEGWAAVVREGKAPVILADHLKVVVMEVNNKQFLAKASSPGMWLEVAQQSYSHKYFELHQGNQDGAVKLKAWRLEAPKAGAMIFWELRDFQELPSITINVMVATSLSNASDCMKLAMSWLRHHYPQDGLKLTIKPRFYSNWINAQRENWLQSFDRLSLPGEELLPVSKLALSRQQPGAAVPGRWALPEHAAGTVGVLVLMCRWATSLRG